MPIEVAGKTREVVYYEHFRQVTGITEPTKLAELNTMAMAAAAIDRRARYDGLGMDAFNVSYKATDLDGTVNAMIAIAMIAENAPVRNMGVMNISPIGQNTDEWARSQVVTETKNAIEAVRELRKEPVGKPFGSTPSDAQTAILRLMDSGKLDFIAAKRGGGPVL